MMHGCINKIILCYKSNFCNYMHVVKVGKKLLLLDVLI